MVKPIHLGLTLLRINYCYAVVYITPWAHYHPPPRGISKGVFMVTIMSRLTLNPLSARSTAG